MCVCVRVCVSANKGYGSSRLRQHGLGWQGMHGWVAWEQRTTYGLLPLEGELGRAGWTRQVGLQRPAVFGAW